MHALAQLDASGVAVSDALAVTPGVTVASPGVVDGDSDTVVAPVAVGCTLGVTRTDDDASDAAEGLGVVD